MVSVQRREAAVKDANLTSVSADLLDVKATEACAAEIAKRFAVTHFIHNAGAIRANLLENTSVEDLAALSQLHLGSAITFAQALVPGMKERKAGRIILISSRAAVGVPTRTVYSATKAGSSACRAHGRWNWRLLVLRSMLLPPARWVARKCSMMSFQRVIRVLPSWPVAYR